MHIGLVGYYPFGNYGDELFVETFRDLFNDGDVTVLSGHEHNGGIDPDLVAQQDCIVIGGGDLVIPHAYAERYWDPVLLTRPVVIAGVGVPLSDRGLSHEAAARMRTFFQHENVRLVTTRDAKSRDWVVTHLRPSVPVRSYPDLVASLDFERRNSHPPTLGLVLRGQRHIDYGNVEALLARAYAGGFRIKNIVLATGFTGDEDRYAAGGLRFPHAELVERDSIEALTYELSGCDIVASQRFHGCLVAMMMGIPAIGLSTEHKFAALFGSLGKELFAADTADPSLPARFIEPMYELPSGNVATIKQQARLGLMEVRGAVVKAIAGWGGTSGMGPLQQRHRPPRPRRYRPYRPYRGYRGGRPPHRREISPRLQAFAQAKLDPAEELTWYRGQLPTSKGRGYLAAIDQFVASTPELAELPAGTRAIVAIPVAGAAEDKTIYGALSLYAQQASDAVDTTTILLYVNYPHSVLDDPLALGNVERTMAEIDRARIDFPRLRVAVVDEAFDPVLAEDHGGIIGWLARRLYDIALLSVERAMRCGRLDPHRDVLLIRNDADTVGLSRNYLSRMIDAANRTSDADVFQGAVRWGIANFAAFPGYGVAVTFKEVLRLLTMRVRGGYETTPQTSGCNVAVRMATFAAVGAVGNDGYFGAGGDDLEIGARINAARLGGSPESERPASSRPHPIRYVTGAQVDATGERMLNTYLSGRNIIETWDTYNNGAAGYTPRSAGAAEANLVDERDDIEGALARIEQNISALATHWYREEALVEAALRLMFAGCDAAPAYTTERTESTYTFTFTPEGRSWMTHRLGGEGPETGEYGMRILRSRYESSPGRAAPMVRAM